MSVTLKIEGARVYFVGNTFPMKDAIRSLGGHWDGENKMWWIGKAKIADAEKLVADSASDSGSGSMGPGKTAQKPEDIRLTGKAEYKGRTYYAGVRTRDGRRIRMLTLPGDDGKFLDFWADVEAVKIVKEYHPREYRGRVEHTTLGSIAAFVRRQQRDKADGVPECTSCGKRNRDLVRDLEDGLMKCPGCCDIPS